MTPREKRALVRRLQAGKRRARARRPQRLADCEARMQAMGAEHKAAMAAGEYRRAAEILRELERVGAERYRLRWGR